MWLILLIHTFFIAKEDTDSTKPIIFLVYDPSQMASDYDVALPIFNTEVGRKRKSSNSVGVVWTVRVWQESHVYQMDSMLQDANASDSLHHAQVYAAVITAEIHLELPTVIILDKGNIKPQ